MSEDSKKHLKVDVLTLGLIEAQVNHKEEIDVEGINLVRKYCGEKIDVEIDTKDNKYIKVKGIIPEDSKLSLFKMIYNSAKDIEDEDFRTQREMSLLDVIISEKELSEHYINEYIQWRATEEARKLNQVGFRIHDEELDKLVSKSDVVNKTFRCSQDLTDKLLTLDENTSKEKIIKLIKTLAEK